MPDRILRSALGAFLLVASAACSEQFTGSLGCPQLCGDQSSTLLDTTLTGALVVDSNLTTFPVFGSVRDFTLIDQGAAADVRLVTRFDTLPKTFRRRDSTADSVLTRVDSATLVFVIDTSVGRPTAPVTLEAFDVDTTAADTAFLSLLPLFRANRLIGSATYQPADVKDTLRLRIKDSVVLSKALAGQRLRVGLRIRSSQAAKLRVAGSLFAPRLTFRASPDTLVRPDTVRLLSKTPTDDPAISSVYSMYSIFAAGTLPPPPTGVLAVGGLSGSRTFLRFEIPPLLIDSVTVVRASLILQQVPSRVAASQSDTVAILINPVLAGPALKDVFTIAQFVGNGTAIGIDSVRLVPKDGGLRSIELVNLFQVWRAAGTANSIRAIVIRAKQEASSPAELNFVSMEGSAALRPRLRLTYVPRRGFGLP